MIKVDKAVTGNRVKKLITLVHFSVVIIRAGPVFSIKTLGFKRIL